MKKILLPLLLSFAVLAAKGQVNAIKLEQLERRLAAGKDTTFVVNFWATWCSPCVAELPYFEQLHNAKRDKIKVLLVSLDFKSKLTSAVVPFVKKMKLGAETLLLDESDQQTYIDRISASWSGAIPATLFVNTSRQIRKFYEKEFTYKELVGTLEEITK